MLIFNTEMEENAAEMIISDSGPVIPDNEAGIRKGRIGCPKMDVLK